jgi:hypothetical protein
MTTSAHLTPLTAPALTYEIGLRAWNWLQTRRDCFRTQPAPRDDPAAWLKPIAELVMLTAVVLREGVSGERQTASARAMLEFCFYDVLGGGEVLDRAQRGAPLCTAAAELYVFLYQNGYRHAGFEETLRTLRTLHAWSARQLPPYRRLGLAVAEHELGLSAATEPDLDALLAATLLGQQPEPWMIDRSLAYDLTHTIFYLTDWGARPEHVPNHIADYFELWLPVWLQECDERQQWDLLAELLAADACLPQPSLDADSWQLLARTQTSDGALPLEGAFPTGDPREVFDLVYHPTLATALAATLATSRALNTLAGTR